MTDGLHVSGGVGGVEARFEDMLAVAGALSGAAGVLRDTGFGVVAVGASPDLLASAVLSPGTAAHVASLVAGLTGGLETEALEVEAHALWLRTAVEGYHLLDAALAYAEDAGKQVLGFGLGFVLGWAPVLVGGVALLDGTVLASFAVDVAGTALVLDTVLRFGENLVTTPPPWPIVGPGGRLPQWAFRVVGGTADDVRGDVSTVSTAGAGLLDAGRRALPGLGAALGRDAGGALFDAPWVTDLVTGGAPGLVTGLTASPLGRLFVALGGGPATSYPDAVARLRAAGNAGGSLFGGGPFLDGTPSVTQVPTPPNPARPTSVQSLFTGIGSMGIPGGHDPKTDPNAGRIRVFSVEQPDHTHAWVVEIPGTQDWGSPGSNPMDLSGNVNVMADGLSTEARGVRDALKAAGIPPGEPVLLSGHSQGGIVAGALAADPGFRSQFHVTAVVTGGSPIARFDIPDSVTVLSLEHTQDPVPRLEGVPNPDRPSWTTVTRDVAGAPQIDSTNPISAHSSDVYALTGRMVDTSTDPSLVQARGALAPFLGPSGHVTTTDYRITRTVP